MTGRDWRRWAVCAGVDLAVFYPLPSTVNAYAEARRMCARCPARAACLTSAMAEEAAQPAYLQRHGFRAGLTAKEREQLAAGVGDGIEHGTTYSAAQRCRRRPEGICAGCRPVASAYRAGRREVA